MGAVQGAPRGVQARAATVLAALLHQYTDGVAGASTPPGPLANKVCANLCKLVVGRREDPPSDPDAAAAAAAADAQAAAGARLALDACCAALGGSLFARLPSLWSALHTPLTLQTAVTESAAAAAPAAAEPRPLRTALILAALVAPSLARAVAPKPPPDALHDLLPHLVRTLVAERLPADNLPAGGDGDGEGGNIVSGDLRGGVSIDGDGDDEGTPMRRLAARAVAVFCDALGPTAFEQTLPVLLGSRAREGGAGGAALGGALYLRALIETLGTRVLPYAALLIAPLVGCLSSGLADVRAHGSAAFGALMPLLPLEPATANPPDMSEALQKRKAAERPFVDQLLGLSGARPPTFELPAGLVRATLRPYQQVRAIVCPILLSSHQPARHSPFLRAIFVPSLRDTLLPSARLQAGVDWLMFLRRFGLHGILCDDMGLGKTLQTLCVLAAAVHERRRQRQSSSRAADAESSFTGASAALTSLVVCPPTLTGHWCAEAQRFCGEGLTVLEYAVAPALPSRGRHWFEPIHESSDDATFRARLLSASADLYFSLALPGQQVRRKRRPARVFAPTSD